MRTPIKIVAGAAIAIVSAWAGAQYAFYQAVTGINEHYTFFVGPTTMASWRARLAWPIGYQVTTYVWPIEESRLEHDRAMRIDVDRQHFFFASRETTEKQP